MTRIVPSVAIGIATGMPILGADLVEQHAINLGVAVSVMVFIAGLIWWLGRKLQNIEDRLDNLPCQRNDGECPTPPPDRSKKKGTTTR